MLDGSVNLALTVPRYERPVVSTHEVTRGARGVTTRVVARVFRHLRGPSGRCETTIPRDRSRDIRTHERRGRYVRLGRFRVWCSEHAYVRLDERGSSHRCATRGGRPRSGRASSSDTPSIGSNTASPLQPIVPLCIPPSGPSQPYESKDPCEQTGLILLAISVSVPVLANAHPIGGVVWVSRSEPMKRMTAAGKCVCTQIQEEAPPTPPAVCSFNAARIPDIAGSIPMRMDDRQGSGVGGWRRLRHAFTMPR